MTGVVVAVATLDRPTQLDRLLASVADCDHAGLDLTVAVVDNDAGGSARSVAMQWNARLPKLVYEIEPIRGYSTARNTLARAACSLRADHVVFVDDDQVVDAQFLHRLVATAETTGADVVAGAVIPLYEHDVPRWVRQGRFFDRPHHVTGKIVRATGIGNVLVRRRVLESLPQPFGRAFLTGGEDTYMLDRLARAGSVAVWCDEAVVHEVISGDRARTSWLLDRAYGGGVRSAQIARVLGASRRTLVVRGISAVCRVAQGLLWFAPLAATRGRTGVVQSTRRVFAGAGGLVGLFASHPELSR